MAATWWQQCTKGTGVAQNPATAASYFAKACDAGDADGCLSLGASYDKGAGVAKNLATAVSYYVRACNAGKR
ncbi:MAG: sel1 repeat family protein [Sphingomonadales bacterium]|nr:sel1 repeat family protein [Sphingomonadales bacterium]